MSKTLRISVVAVILWPIAVAQPPAITPPGIYNSASKMPSSLPGGKLAPGATITIAGLRLVDSKSDTVVEFRQGDWQKSSRPISIRNTELDVQLPADTPAGEVELRVTNAQGSSRAHMVEVVPSSPAILTLNGEGWGPVNKTPVQPGGNVTIQVNGLNERRPKLLVGGIVSPRVSTRGQEITFQVPANAPHGCWTPFWIESASGALSNFATIAIEDRRKACDPIEGWPARAISANTREGIIVLARVQGSFEFPRGVASPFDFAGAAGLFFQAGSSAFTPSQTLPPAGTCTAYTSPFALVFENFLSIQKFFGQFQSPLSVGPSVVIDNGVQQRLLDGGKAPGPYLGFLGGLMPLMRTSSDPVFLKEGSYAIHSDGSDQIGKLDFNMDVPPLFEWLEQSSLTAIDRTAGVELHWRDQPPRRQMVFIAISVDQNSATMGSCVCVAAPAANHLSVPAYAFANFPATQPNETLPLRFILLGSIPSTPALLSAPKGLDEMRAVFVDLRGKSVVVR